MNTSADTYFTDGCGRCKFGGTPQCKVHTWEPILAELRKIILESGLTETCKWGMPAYTDNGKNILILAAFKEYCSLNFFKGALIPDPANILTANTENTEVSRQVRITELDQIEPIRSAILDCIREAVEIEKSGKKVVTKSIEEWAVPEEFQAVLDSRPELKTAFESLTPGRRKAYLIHFGQPKQSTTKVSRIEKCIPAILAGKGLNE